VDRASLYNLVNGTNLVHNLFLEFFVHFIYNLYMFWTSPGPSSGGTTVFMRHLTSQSVPPSQHGLTNFIPSCLPDSQLYRHVSRYINNYLTEFSAGLLFIYYSHILNF